MSQNEGDFTPVVKGGYESDDAKHRRNWRQLSDFLRSPFVTRARIGTAAIGEAQIDDLAVTDAKIANLSVSKLTAGTLGADVIIGSKISTAETGQRVEIDSNGIRLTDGTVETVTIPVSGESTFKGGLDATSMVAQAPLLQGGTIIDSGASVSFAQGISNPTSAPALAWVYTTDTLSPTKYGYQGGDRTSTHAHIVSPSTFNVASFNVSTGAESLKDTDRMGGPLAGTGFSSMTPYGVTILGSYAYVLGLSNIGSPWVMIVKWALSGGVIAGTVLDWGAWPLDTYSGFTNLDYLAGITNDGTDLYVFWVNTSGDIKRHRISTTFGIVGTATQESGACTGGNVAYDACRRVENGATWWVAMGNTNTGAHSVRAYDNTPARVSGQDFTQPNMTKSIFYNATDGRFESIPVGATNLRRHTAWVSSQAYVHAKYSWYDNANGYETLASAQSYATMVRRSNLRVTSQSLPPGVDRTRFYLIENGVTSNPAAGGMWLQSTVAGNVATYSSYTGSGTADRTTTSFPVSASGELRLPLGAGAYAGSGSALEGEVYYDTTDDGTYVYNGTAWHHGKPFIGARMYQNTAWTHNSGASSWDQVLFDTEEFDTGPNAASRTGIADLTADDFKCPSGLAGIWRITGQIEWSPEASGNRRAIQIKVNSTVVARQLLPNSGTEITNSVSCITTLAAADLVSLEGWQNSSGNLASAVGREAVFFEIEYLGPKGAL